MYADQLTVNGETFVGLMGLASDRYAVISPHFKSDSVLGVPTVKAKACGTYLNGLFCAGNSNGILVTHMVQEQELLAMKSFMGALGVEVLQLQGLYTALGNLIACNDRGALVSSSIRDYGSIEDALGVEVVSGDVRGHLEVGSYIAATNRGFLAHPCAEAQLDKIKDALKVGGMVGTVNRGVPYVRTGLIANSNGYITGGDTTGIEMQRIEDALGLV